MGGMGGAGAFADRALIQRGRTTASNPQFEYSAVLNSPHRELTGVDVPDLDFLSSQSFIH